MNEETIQFVEVIKAEIIHRIGGADDANARSLKGVLHFIETIEQGAKSNKGMSEKPTNH